MIIGSAQQNSHTRALGQYLIGQFNTHDCCDLEIFDLAEKPIHTLDFTGVNEVPEAYQQHAKELQEKAREADFFILGTPNYHGTFSGNLKNALDHLTMDDFKMKPVGLVCNSGGIVSSEPLSHLRVVVRTLLGIAVPTQIATHDHDYGKTEDGKRYLKDEEFQLRARLFVDQIVSFVNNAPYDHLK